MLIKITSDRRRQGKYTTELRLHVPTSGLPYRECGRQLLNRATLSKYAQLKLFFLQGRARRPKGCAVLKVKDTAQINPRHKELI